jgi:hypothetical protein
MLSNLSKSVHTGENSQILTVSNKKTVFRNYVYQNLRNYTAIRYVLSMFFLNQKTIFILTLQMYCGLHFQFCRAHYHS